MNTSAKRAVAACALLASTALSTSAHAQTTFPATHDNAVGAGVDLKRGSYTHASPDITIGTGEYPQQLALVRYQNSEFPTYPGTFGLGTSTNFDIKIYEAVENGQNVSVLTIGFGAQKYTRSGNDFIPQSRDGSTLQKLPIAGTSTFYYLHKSRNGEQLILLPGLPCTTSFGSCYYVDTWRSPSMGDVKFYYDVGGRLRLRSVIGDFGRALYFSYPSSSEWKASTVTAVNLAEHHCRAICTPPAGLPETKYSYTGDMLTGVMDANGKTTAQTYDGANRLQSIRQPSNPNADFLITRYDASGKVESQTWNDKNWTYAFTTDGSNITEARATDPLTGATVTRFGTKPVPTSVTDPANRTTAFEYDEFDRPLTRTWPNGVVQRYDADGRGNIKKITVSPNPNVSPRPQNRVVEFGFSADCSNQVTCNRPLSMTNSRGTTGYGYDPITGNLTRVTAPPATPGAPQAETRYEYETRQAYIKDANGNPTRDIAGSSTAGVERLLTVSLLKKVARCSTTTADKCAGAADEIVSTFDYGPTTGLTNLNLVSATEDATGMALTSRFTYNAVGDLTAADGPRPGADDTTRTEFDRERRVVKITSADPDGSGSLAAPVTMFGYDDDGRLTRIARQNGSAWLVSCTRYSAAGLVTREWGAAETGSPDACPAEGDPVPVIDYGYDDAGRLSTSTQRMPADQGGDRVSKVEYFPDGQVRKERLGVGSPDEQDYRTFTYTADGLPETVKDARGNLTTYEYNGFDELKRLRYPDKANGAVSSTTDVESYGYDANGNLDTLIQRDGSTIGFGYDALGRMVSKDVPEADRDVSYTYDLLGRMTTASLPAANAGLSVAWSYDKLGRPLSETMLGRTVGHSYDAAGAWEDVTLPGGGLTIRRDYDALGRMSSVGQGGILTYNYDQLSRRTSVANANHTSTTYVYDALGRLQSLSHDLAGTAKDVTFSLSYNRAEQITSRGSADAYAWDNALNMDRGYQANPLDQYTQADPGSLSYDGRGNLARDARQTYTHDSENQLTGVSGSANTLLAYDAIGRLAWVTSGGQVTELSYDRDQLVAEYDGSGNVLRRYMHGAGVDEPVLQWEGSGTNDPRWLHADERGSIIAGSNASGASMFTNSYGPFGEPGKVHTGTFGYTGQMRLPGVGLYYYKARYYSPTLGRFIETDPIGTANDQNRYGYVGNDAINLTDPLGLQATPAVFSGYSSQPLTNSNMSYQITGYSPNEIVITATRSSWWGQDIVSDNYYRNNFALSGAAAGAVIGAWLGGGGGAAGGTLLCAPSGPFAAGCGAAGGVAGAIQGGVAGGVVGSSIGGVVGTVVDYTRVLYNKAVGDGDHYKSPTSGSGKEKASDIPSWVRQNSTNRPHVGETPNVTAARVMNAKYGEGNWSKSTGEYSQIQKWAARSFR